VKLKDSAGPWLAAAALVACSGGGSVSSMGSPSPAPTQISAIGCLGTVPSSSAPGSAPVPATNLSVPASFHIEIIARISGPRELAALPNGDLLVGTNGSQIFIVPNAEASSAAGSPQVFATLNDTPAAGVTFVQQSCTVYAATQFGIYAMPYHDAELNVSNPTHIASFRQGGGGGHSTSSVAFSGSTLYASVGSSCNACVESDPTRATIQQMSPNGTNMSARAIRIRNAIALTINPDTGTLWAGDAGQDDLPLGHPFEFFDAVTHHAGVADYGWPDCEENHNNFGSGASCVSQVIPAVELPAYSTIIGAAFYSKNAGGAHAFPQSYRGGAFVAAHGSWHQNNGTYVAPPRVAFIPMIGDAPVKAVNWGDPTVQWTEFVGGFQLSDGVTRVGRPTGLAVGSQGSLFVADDEAGAIYRIRPR
jgi:glucose/arabinose dehydrogenase